MYKFCLFHCSQNLKVPYIVSLINLPNKNYGHTVAETYNETNLYNKNISINYYYYYKVLKNV